MRRGTNDALRLLGALAFGAAYAGSVMVWRGSPPADAVPDALAIGAAYAAALAPMAPVMERCLLVGTRCAIYAGLGVGVAFLGIVAGLLVVPWLVAL